MSDSSRDESRAEAATGRIAVPLTGADEIRGALALTLRSPYPESVRLAAQLRRLGELAAANDATDAEVAALADELAALADRLAGRGRTTRHRSIEGRGHELFLTHPVIGPFNPIAPPLVLRVDGDRVVGTATYPLSYEGASGFVQGGHISAAFDAALALAAGAAGRIGPTKSLEVHYLAPTPIRRPIEFEAEVESIDRRRTLVVGTARCGDTLTARAVGTFVMPRT